jgi:sugar diacid utilization regulator
MKVSLAIILEKLTVLGRKLSVREDGADVTFESLRLFSSSLPPSDKETLYVGFLRDMLALEPQAVEGRTFCVIGSLEELKQARRKYGCRLVYFQPPADLAACYSDIQLTFDAVRRMEEAMDRVLLKRGDLQELIDIFEPLFDNPIYIWDDSFQIQAMSNNIVNHHPILREISLSRRLPISFLAAVSEAENKFMQKADSCTTLQIHHPPNVINTQFALRVYVSGRKTVLVFCCYFTNSPATPGRFALLRILTEKLNSYAVECYPKSDFKTKFYESFIMDLLEGRLYQENEIKERLTIVRLPYETHYRVYYITPLHPTDSIIRYLTYSSKTRLPYAKVLPYKGGIVALDMELKEARDKETVMKKKEEALENLRRSEATCGVSLPCFNLSQVRKAFLQAEVSLELGQLLQPENKVYYYRDYYIYHLLHVCADHPEIDLSLLCSHGFKELKRNDLKTKNNNMQLLEIYLLNNCSVTCTAKAMHLHRNSVMYRIERIEKILEVSLSDPKIRMRLLISFYIYRLQDVVKSS